MNTCSWHNVHYLLNDIQHRKENFSRTPQTYPPFQNTDCIDDIKIFLLKCLHYLQPDQKSITKFVTAKRNTRVQGRVRNYAKLGQSDTKSGVQNIKADTLKNEKYGSFFFTCTVQCYHLCIKLTQWDSMRVTTIRR